MKKKVLLVSNYPGTFSGFGGFVRELLTHLYKTDKYELCSLGAGLIFKNHPDFMRWPWKCYGTIPDDPIQHQRMNSDPQYARDVNYGFWAIDKVVNEFKPDVIILSEDIWAFNGYEHKKFWNKIPCIIHTTLDSRPILDRAIELAKVTPYFYSWADFATKEMNKMGLSNVKTLRGTVDTNSYKKLPKPIKDELRHKHNIPLDSFNIGFVFRNQLRKSVFALIEGYSLFKKQNPNIKTRLILPTNWSESWDIKKLVEEFNLDKNEVLAVYKCRATQDYFVLPFNGQEIDSPKGHPKSLVTIGVDNGITNEQLNEVYNLMDVYCHPLTSGGQERPIQEAKLCELITLVTNYSCGEDCCQPEAKSLSLDWAPYREPGSQFIKAATKPESIATQLGKAYRMTAKEKEEYGKQARKWVLENFSIEVIRKQFEELIDSMPAVEYDYSELEVKDNPNRNPYAQVPNIQDNATWITELYRQILGREPDEGGFATWMNSLDKGMPRSEIHKVFVQTAERENQDIGRPVIENFLDKNENPEDRILLSLPGTLGDLLMVTSLLKDCRELYPDKKIYFGTQPQYFDILRPAIPLYLDGLLPFTPEMNQPALLEGAQGSKKYFDIAIALNTNTQIHLNYYRGGKDKSKIDLNY